MGIYPRGANPGNYLLWEHTRGTVAGSALIDRDSVPLTKAGVAFGLKGGTRIDQREIDIEEDGARRLAHVNVPSKGPATTTAAREGSSARRAAA